MKKLKIHNLMLFLCYIISSFLFYKIIYIELPNIKIFEVTSVLMLFEIIFWKQIFNILKNNLGKLTKDEKILEITFIFIIAIIGIFRMLILSSGYISDITTNNVTLMNVVGIFRILNLLVSISLIYYTLESKKILLNLISIINIVIAVMIWLEFDGTITAILRIVLGILGILSLYIYKKNNLINKETQIETLESIELNEEIKIKE